MADAPLLHEGQTRHVWMMEGEGTREGGSKGGSIQIWRRCERSMERSGNRIKIGSRGNEALGTATGGSQNPENREAPRTQRD